MTEPRRIPLRAGIALALLVVLAPALARAHLSTYDDIWRVVLAPNCNNCHGPLGGAQSGGMIAADDSTGTEQSWYNVLVGAPPANGAAQALGKLRVTPFQPWNSFLLDKLSAHLKRGEGRPMPFGTSGYSHNCPGAIDKITKWILAGAPYETIVAGDTAPGTVNCNALAQPAFTPPAAGSATPLLGDPFAVSGTTAGRGDPREAEQVSTRTLAADIAVGRIEIAASSGTEYVVVSRESDPAPLAVARGAALDLTLPEGVAVLLSAGDTITIRQRIRNDHWVKDLQTNVYVNRTDGNVAVNLHPSPSATREARPFIDTTGTQALFVPPRLLGETGGIWAAPEAIGGAVVGVWGDLHVIEAAIVDPVGQTLATTSGDPVTSGYVTLTEASRPASLLAYQCTHSNAFTTTTSNSLYGTEQLQHSAHVLATTTLVNRPMKFSCLAMAPVAFGLPPTTGTPAILGQATAADCARSIHDPAQTTPFGPAYDDSECTDTAVDNCGPANLVGGDGVNEGRCSLIGLAW